MTCIKVSKMSARYRAATCALSAIAMIGYVCLGSLLFNAVENSNGEGNTNEKIKMVEKLKKNVELLRNLSNLSIAFNGEDYSRLLDDTYNVTVLLFKAEQLSYLPWNFFTGIHFCLTAITTIGYGYIAPVTQLGRGLCVLYVVFGIPINIFFSAKLAYFIAKWITQLYVLLEKLTGMLFCKTRSQSNISLPNVDKIDVAADFSSLHDAQRGTSRSIQYINSSFSTADETMSPRSEECFLRETPRFGRINETDLVSSTLPSIKDSLNTTKNAHLEAQQPNDEETHTPLWFMFILMATFCSLTSVLVYSEEYGNLTYLDAFYYVVITFTTVGFGDIHHKSSRDFNNYETIWWKMIYTYILMEVGLVIMAAFITLWADRVQKGVKRAQTSLQAKHASRNSTGVCNVPKCHLHGKFRTSHEQGTSAKETEPTEGTNL